MNARAVIDDRITSRNRLTRLIDASILGFAVIAAGALASVLWRNRFDLQFDVNEAWNAWHALRWAAGLPLYPAADDLIANNYPPLSFWLTGAWARAGGDPVWLGRLLSIAALAFIGVSVAGCIRELGGSRRAGCYGALWYAASMGIAASGYVGMNDPSLPALAIMAGGAWLCLRADRLGGSLLPGLAVMVLAGFYKHNLVATPLAMLVWLALTRGRRALVPILAALALVGLGLAACTLAYGAGFFEQLLMPRQTSVWRMVMGWEPLPWVAMMVAPLWAFRHRDSRAGRFVWTFLLVGFAIFMLQKAGKGIGRNAQFEYQFAIAIGLGLAVDQFVAAARTGGGATRIAFAMLALLVAKEALLGLFGPVGRPLSPAYVAEVRARQAVAEAEIERVRAIVGPVHCSMPVICLRAGKGFAYDAFAMDQRVATGAWSQARLDAAAAAQAIRFEAVDPRVEWPR